jgi:exodeoxyribonuclease-5
VELSEDQANALDRVVNWFQAAPASTYCEGELCEEEYPHTHGNAHGYPVLSIGGLAGSGKTWLTGQLSEVLGARCAYGAPTHRAAAVLRGKLDERDALNVRTYHSLLYQARATYRCLRTGRPVTEIPCGCPDPEECDCSKAFKPCVEPSDHTCQIQEDLKFTLRTAVGGRRDLIILDEASMVSEERVKEIASLGVPVLLVGDHGQLAPVKEEMNRWMKNPDIVLTTNHRQSDVTGIISAARHVRETGRLPLGTYGDGSTACVSAALRPEVLAVASRDRLPPSPNHAIITHTNKLRAAVNRGYRDTPAHLAAPGQPVVGDRVVSLQNGDRVIVTPGEGLGRGEDGWRPTGEMEFVFNGSTGTIRSVRRPERPGQRWVTCVVELDADRRGKPGCHVLTQLVVKQLGAESRLAPNEYPDGRHLWDLAYALTAHKAQGSEFSRVVVLDTKPPEPKRWLYTAMTRAKDKLVVVNWNR